MRTLWTPVLVAALLAGSSVGVAGQSDQESTQRVPVPSVGCGDSGVVGGVLRGQRITVGDTEREWAMYVPEAHDGIHPVPLWVQVHGRHGAAALELNLVKPIAKTQDFVVVAPQGIPGNPAWLWRAEDRDVDLTSANPDIAFVETLIDHLGEQLCLDLSRVYAAGESQGGYAVTGLACALEDRIAAVATVGALYDLGERCDLERPVPHLHVHGMADDITPFEGGLDEGAAHIPVSDGTPYIEHPIVKAYALASVSTRVTGVAVRNGCEPAPAIEDVGEGMERWIWDCPTGAGVELVTHGGGYGWPMTEPVFISERIWEFFEQHPMPE